MPVYISLLSLLLVATVAARRPLELPLPSPEQAVVAKYFSNAEMVAHIAKFSRRCSSISRTFSVGKSQKGQNLIALELSDKPGQIEAEPYFLYFGNIHGDEPTGRQLLLALAEWLCANYQKDPLAKRVINEMHLVLLPSANPDGFDLRIRENSAGVDLNRDFPDPILHKAHDLHLPLPDSQKETAALMMLAQKMRFTGSAALHEGAVVANYPYDGYQDGSTDIRNVKNSSPDDATFQFLAATYANKHPTMHDSKEFPGGITNGAKWYPLYGGSQDWHYLVAGCMEITLELSQRKHPDAGLLPQLWEDNRDALLTLAVQMALGGVRGVVREAATNKPLLATISIKGVAHNIYTVHLNGYYSRPLAPGDYEVQVSATDHKPQTRKVTVPKDGSGTVQDFTLELDENSVRAREKEAQEDMVLLSGPVAGPVVHVEMPTPAAVDVGLDPGSGDKGWTATQVLLLVAFHVALIWALLTWWRRRPAVMDINLQNDSSLLSEEVHDKAGAARL